MNTVAQLDSTDFSACARAFSTIHCGASSEAFADNLHTEVTTFDFNGVEFPTTIGGDALADNAWVCSPSTAYGDYAAEEVKRFGHPLLTWPLLAVCRSLAKLMRYGELDRAVAINNWLLSTNLYPLSDDYCVQNMRDAAIGRWPAHAIWLRSLNWHHNRDWLIALLAAGFDLIPSRQVYLVTSIGKLARRSSNLKSDLRLLSRMAFSRVESSEFQDKDYSRAAKLYAQLYTHRYSELNPRYSAKFIGEWHRAGLLKLNGVRDATGELQAIVGIFSIGTTVTAPIVGYNTALPQKAGLYRLLMAWVAETALTSDAEINFSAGAAQFKRLRGAVPAMEYSAVYSAHLPQSRRRPITALKKIAEHIGAPIMRSFKL